MNAAGTVEAIGDGVDRLAVGDSVIAVVNPRLPEGGAQAELIIVPAASVVRAPPGVDPAEASTLPMTGLTGLEGLPCSTLPPENVGAPFWLRDDFVVVVEAGQELRLGVRCRRSFNDGLRSERRLLRAAY
jgi:NADPH:quinone reductase-like Zn-dependent oxidoreductase